MEGLGVYMALDGWFRKHLSEFLFMYDDVCMYACIMCLPTTPLPFISESNVPLNLVWWHSVPVYNVYKMVH